MIGLTGTQRTGKSTLARTYAERNNLLYVATSAAEVYRMVGLDPKREYPIADRVGVQEAILEAFEQQYAKATAATGGLFIADRTPLDLAGYLLADIQRSTVASNPALSALIVDYVKRCIEATNRHFSTVLLVQPGIAASEAETSAPACIAFQTHHNLLIKGLMLEEGMRANHMIVPARLLDLEQRLQCLSQAINYAFTQQTRARNRIEEQGVSFH